MRTSSPQRGFTLIEMIVALGLFSVVTTITTGAVLMLVGTNQKFHYEQSIMTNLSFAIDSMTREMRTGTRYYCASAANMSSGIFGTTAHESLGDSTQDCVSGRGNNDVHGVSFIESGDSVTGSGTNRILYFYARNYWGTNQGAILRRVGNNPAESVTSSGVHITAADFLVRDTERLLGDPTPLNNDADQPSITMYLTAQAADDTDVPPRSFTIQTTISQRSLDL